MKKIEGFGQLGRESGLSLGEVSRLLGVHVVLVFRLALFVRRFVARRQRGLCLRREVALKLIDNSLEQCRLVHQAEQNEGALSRELRFSGPFSFPRARDWAAG